MLNGALSENLLCLLSFDEINAPIIRGVVDHTLFGGPYTVISGRIYDYLDKFKRPPGDHLADILSDKLESKTPREAQYYGDIIDSIHAAQAGINTAYVMSQLENFVQKQSLSVVAIDLVKALQRDDLDEAQKLISSANQIRLSVFDPGTRLSDKDRALRFLDMQEACFPTGIPELDRRGFGPNRKELWLLVANTKSGKSWALIHLAKMALVHRLKVCHITLEMSEERCAQRYMQALFAISKRKEPVSVAKLNLDSLGRIAGIGSERITAKMAFVDSDIRNGLDTKLARWSRRLLDNIYIKQFPTGSLTVARLRAYLDNLEATERFIPDLLLVDYPDLFKIDRDSFRLSLDEVYKDLRGIAVARNMAVAVVSQSHRSAAKAKQVEADNVAEAYSKISHADTVLTLSSTAAERKLGLARMHIAAGRNDEDKQTIIITQNLSMGQFAMESNLLRGNYWDFVPEGTVGE